MDPASSVSQNVSNSSNPAVQVSEKPGGFFRNVGGIAKKVVAPLGVEIATAVESDTETNQDSASNQIIDNQAEGTSLNTEESRPPVVLSSSEPAIAQPAQEAFTPLADSVSPVEPSEAELEINILNDTVFKENPGAFLTKIDGKLHLDKEKLAKAANKFLMDPQNLKKIIEANPHLSSELKDAGISLD